MGSPRGKGVTVAADLDAAFRAVDAALVERRFGAAGQEIVVEDFLEGEEASFFALVDGKDALPLATAQDHKRLATATPARIPAAWAPCRRRRLLDSGARRPGHGPHHPAHGRGDAGSGTAVFKGILYAGLMLTESGPMLLEYNVRFGDPEAQALMMRLISDPLPALIAAHDGILRQVDLRWHADAALCVVMAARGYPDDPQRGSEIRGLDAAGSRPGEQRSSTPPPAASLPRPTGPAKSRPEDRLRPGARGSLPMVGASSASPRWAATSPKPATAPTPRSTGSTGPKASAAATSAAVRSRSSHEAVARGAV